jgi:CBS domain containing-hemolysin-like protein
VLRHSEVPAPLAFLFVVPFTLTLGELVPKTVFQYHADSLVPVLVFPLRLCGLALSPVLWVFDAIIRVAGGVELGDRPLTREGIRILLNVSQDPNLSPEDKAMIRRVFAFTEAVVEDVMVPLIHVVAVPDSSTCAEAAEHMIRSGHSRLPVYKERIDDITGVLLNQDLMSTQDWGTAVSEICRTPLFVPETKRVDHLLQDMRRLRLRMAVVVDEYGGAVGLITVEDLIEEIVGEIEDESDRSRTRVRRLDDRNWLALGRSEREHLEATCGLQLPDGDFETLAGYVLTTVGRIPKTGECVQLGEYSLTVSNVSDRAILEVHIRRTRA